MTIRDQINQEINGVLGKIMTDGRYKVVLGGGGNTIVLMETQDLKRAEDCEAHAREILFHLFRVAMLQGGRIFSDMAQEQMAKLVSYEQTGE